MFFELSKKPNELYTNFYDIGDYVLSTDEGWKTFYSNGKKAIAKGYCLEVPLEQAAFEIPQYRGFFCSIAETSQGVLITHGIFRTFDLVKIDGGVSSFDFGEVIPHNAFWRENQIEYFETCPFEIKTPNNLNEAIDLIDSYLEENVRQFFKLNPCSIISTVTAGMDTSTVNSYLESLGIPNTPIIDIHFEFTQFYLNNAEKFGKLCPWIRNVNVYRDPVVVTSGDNGDWMFFRDKLAMAVLDENGTYTYEDDDYMDLTYKNLSNIPLTSMSDMLYSINKSANFIRHFGNTIYFNPLLDMRIPVTLSKLDKDVLVHAVKKSTIQRQLIAKRCPWIAKLLPAKKEVSMFFEPSPRKTFLSKVLEINKDKKIINLNG